MNIGVRNFPGDAERNQRGRMGVKDSLDVGAHFVDGAVEREFAGGLVAAFDRAVRLDADDVLAAQRSFVDPGGTDPHIPVGIEDREVAAAGGRHPVAVDSLHDVNDLIARMNEISLFHKSDTLSGIGVLRANCKTILPAFASSRRFFA